MRARWAACRGIRVIARVVAVCCAQKRELCVYDGAHGGDYVASD